ncbi:hypothetical protein MMC17_005842, partial [Xylographa soralifera]|nr:hypothetical protein [Xylographa soralifera]
MLSDEDKKNINSDRKDKLAILRDLLIVVDKKKQVCMEKRWKYKKGNQEVIIRDQLEKVVVWVDKFKEVGDAAVQYDTGYASVPWAAVRFILQLAVNDSQIFGAMVEGVEHISNLITRYAIIEHLHLQNTAAMAKDQLSQSLVKVYTAILQYLSKAKRYYDRNTAKRMGMAILQTAESNVKEYLDKILVEEANVDSCVRLVGSEVGLNLKDGLQRLEALLHQLDDPINRSATQLSDLHDSFKKSERLELFQWLSTIPHITHHKTIGNDWMARSGQWLLRNKEFISWRKSSVSSVLWLHGIPGSGKTKLVFSIIQHLHSENNSSSAPAPIAYFYCARNTAEPQRADPDEIMRSILKQLSSSKPDLSVREPIAKEYRTRKEEAEQQGCEPAKLTIAECEELILALLEHNPATIIIDALDECISARRYEILKTLNNIIQKSASLVKVFVSSRDDNDIVCRLKDSPNVIIHASDNSKDIERFIHSEVEKTIEDKRMLRGDISDELKNQIITTLANGANGMFRWVSLQIQNLCDAQRIKDEEELVEELGHLPETLRESYDIIYKRIQASGGKSQVIAKKAFKWLLCAQRPLESLEFIAAVDLHGQHSKKSNDILLDMCCNLVVLDVELDIFRFAHLSVREYIEDLDEYTNIEIHKLAAERCIDTYICKTFKPSTTEQNNVLIPYATLYWPVHCQYIKCHLTDKLKGKIRQFALQDGGVSPLFLNWISATRKLHKQLNWEDPLRRKLQTVFSSPYTPLFLACCFGLFSSVDDLTTLKNVNWNQRNEDGKTGLQVAAEEGHIEVVKKLLTAEADVNAAAAATDNGRTALQAAAEGGHIEVVEKLLAAKANVNAAAAANYGRTALQAAARKGHIE